MPISPAIVIIELMQMQLKKLNTLTRGKSSVVNYSSHVDLGSVVLRKSDRILAISSWLMMKTLGGQFLIEAFISREKQLNTRAIQLPDSRLFLKTGLRNSSKQTRVNQRSLSGKRKKLNGSAYYERRKMP